MLYVACWGGSTCLFLQYLLQAYTVFTKKDSIIYKLLVAGLFVCYLESTLSMVYVGLRFYAGEETPSIGNLDPLTVWYLIYIPTNIAWFAMIQIVTWLYVLRISSLGAYMPIDRYIRHAPIIVGILQLPNFIINLARLNLENEIHNYFVISSSIFSIFIIFIEFVMFLVLMAKLNYILEYRASLMGKMARHLKITCIVVIVLEIAMAGIRFTFLVDFSISPIIYLLRIYIIIQFYSDLLVTINKECKTINSLQFKSENSKEKKASDGSLDPTLSPSTNPSESTGVTATSHKKLDVLYKRSESPIYIPKTATKLISPVPNFTFSIYEEGHRVDYEASIETSKLAFVNSISDLNNASVTNISDQPNVMNLSITGPKKRQSRNSTTILTLTQNNQ